METGTYWYESGSPLVGIFIPTGCLIPTVDPLRVQALFDAEYTSQDAL